MGIASATRISLLAALCAMPAAPAFAQSAGTFQFVAGDVRLALAGGAERPARKGTPLAKGDTVVTARAGTAQIKMGDGAILVVQPDSRLTVVEFRYAGVEDGTERVVYRLEQGGFRAITGAIGRRHKDAYHIETPVAQLGVRGTDHETYYLPVATSSAPAGAYNKVNVGASYIRTRGGEVVVGPSQAGYAASVNDAPRLLAQIPSFFNGAAQPRPAFVYPSQERVASAPVEQPVMTTTGLNLSDPQAGAASPGPPVTTPPTSPSTPTLATGSAVGYIAGNIGNSGFNLTVSPGGATQVNTGGDTAFGVNWGTWQGGAPTVDGVATVGGVHVISSSMLTSASELSALPANGVVSATYSYAGGPAPTNQAGTAGAVNSLSVGVNFSSQTITSYSLNASAGTATWSANATNTPTISQFGTSGVTLSGQCSGCAGGGTPTASGTAHGALVGPNAERMITTFGLKAASEAISGAALLRR